MRLYDWLESLFERFQPDRSKKTRAYRDRFVPILRVTRLESRCVLNAAPIPVPVVPPAPASLNSAPLHSANSPSGATNPNVLVVAAADMLRQSPQSAPEASLVRIVREGSNIDVFVNGREIESVPLSQIDSIDVVGTQGPDTLVVDYSGGNPLPAGGIVFESGNAAALDTLVVDGGSAQSVNLAIGAGGNGALAIDGGQVRFSGVVSVVDMLAATTTDVALAEGGQNWSVGDGPQPGQLRLESSNGTQLTLADSQTSLIIDTRLAGTLPGDKIQVGDLNVSTSSLVSIFGRQSDTVDVTGNVQLGQGSLAIDAGTETVAGTIGASGGSVTLSATSALTISNSGFIRDSGGSISVDAGATGTLLDYGTIDVSTTATGATGGSVQLLGKYVGLTGDARIDASGNSGGGTILIGGDEHGANAGVRDATRAYVGQDVTLSADALVQGHGGKIVVWSNDVTLYFGSLSARGGAAGGDGGLAEVSGAESLNFLGNSDLSAAFGQTGILLLDPTTITIQHKTSATSADDGQLDAGTPATGNGSTIGVIDFADTPSAMTISDFKINAIGATNNIELDATQSITANNNVSVSVAHNLLLQTTNATTAGVIDLSNGSFATTGTGTTITISASTSGTTSGNITLGALTTAGGDIIISTGKGSIAVNGAVDAGAGIVTLTAAGGISETGTITAGAVAVTNTAAGDVDLSKANVVSTFSGSNTTGNITFSDGKATLTINGVDTSAANNDISIANTGSISVNGALTAGTGNVSLTATTGIGETATGSITAAALSVTNNTTSGVITLGQSANAVSTFSGSNTKGNITFVDTKAALTVNGVDTSTAANKNITITNTAGSLAMAGTLTAGNGTVTLSATAGMTETGTITAGTLGVTNTTAGDVTLGTANVVSTFSGSNTVGNITFVDTKAALTVNGVDTSTAANKNITITNTAGSLAVAGTVTAGTGTVTLSATAGMTETGTITAGAVGVTNTTAGDVALGTANVVGAFSGSNTAGNVTFNDGIAALTVNGVDTSAASNDIAITNTAGTIAVAGTVNAGAGTVTLTSAGTISETGKILAGALAATTTSGDITLGSATNSVATFAAKDSAAGGTITFNDAAALTVGTVSGVVGQRTNSSDITLATAGALTLSEAVSTSSGASGTVRLQAVGNVTQAAAGIITGLNLGVNTALGDIGLGLAPNVVSGTFGATALTGGVEFRDSLTYNAGSVAAVLGLFLGANGITASPAGNITLISDTSLDVNSALTTTGIVRLQAGGNITQTAAITAASLGASTSSGNIDLENAGNSIATFAAQNTDGTTPGTITFKNSLLTPLTIGTVAAAADGSTSALAGVVSNKGSITLSTAGALTLNQAVSTGSGASGTVRLQATGAITQAAAGIITGLNLGVNTNSSGDVVLGLAPNAVSGTFGATAASGSVEFRDSVTCTEGAVTALAGLFLGANGITVAAAGNITLISDTSLNVNSALTTTGTVRLQAAGDVIQTAAISAGSLGVFTSSGKIDLENASNSFSILAARNTDGTATPGVIIVIDSITTPLAVGTVGAAADGSTSTITGVVSTTGNITLATAGALTLNRGVSTGSGASGTVRLQAAGDISQAVREIITGASLGVYDTAGNITLDQANVVGTAGAAGTIAMQNTAGTIEFLDATTGTLQTGTVALSGAFTNPVTGVVSNTADITLSTAGALTLNQAVSAGSGASGTVRLQAAGDITQAAGGIITGLNLGVNTPLGNIALGLAPNVVSGTFGATATTGNVEFRDSLTYTAGTVTPLAGLFLGSSGITASAAGNITLISDTSLNVTSALATTGTVRLQATGNVTQRAAIVAGSLGVSTSSGNIDLENAGNLISTFAAQNTDGATPGTITFKVSLATPLTIGTVAAAADGSTSAQTGVVSNKGNITLSTVGALTVNQGVSTGSGASSTVRLQAAGDITQAASGIITALNLGLNTPLGDIVLGLAPNAIGGTFGATATTGSVEFRDSLALTPGSVTAVPGLFLGANGITVSPAGNITLIADTSLSMNSVLTTAGTVRLQAAGDITQTAAIVAGALGVSTSSGKIDLENSGNSFSILAARNTDGTAAPGAIIVSDSIVTPLIVGTVAAAADGSTSAVTAVVSNTGNITLTTAGALTLNQGISTSSGTTGTVRLHAGGDVLQTTVDVSGRIVAGALDVFTTAGSILLQNPSNTVSTIDLELPIGATSAISYAADGNFAVQKITSAGNVTLTSRNGSILNGNSGDPNEIAAWQLLLRAPGGGVGTAADLLRTSTASLSAVAGSGGVHLLNNGTLTIVSVPPATGITAAAGGIDVVAAGNLTIAGSVLLNGSGSLSLVAQALNSAVGDVNLLSSGTISAPGNIAITASHDFNATSLPSLTDVVHSFSGMVSINAGNSSNIVQPPGALSLVPPVPGFTIQTATGITATEPPFLLVTPLFVSPGVAIAIDGKTSLAVTFGRPIETNLSLVIAWGDGTTSTLASATAGTSIFTHTFLVNSIEANTTGGAVGQLGGTTAFAPTVTLRGDPSLAFVVHGQSVTTSQQVLLLIAPGLGLAGTNIESFGSRGFVNFGEQEVSVVGAVTVSIAGASQSSQLANQTSPGEATAAGVDKLVLRVGPTDASQKEDQGDSIELSEEDNIDINNLTSASIQALFYKLPDGRYRLMWQHGTGTGVVTERVIFDVLLRDGKPINFDDLEKPPVPSPAAPPKQNAAPQPAARLAEPGDAAADQARSTVPAEAEAPYLAVAEFARIQSVAAFLNSGELSYGQSGQDVLPHSADPSTDDADATSDEADSNCRVACGLAPAGALIEMALLRQQWNRASRPAAASTEEGLFSRASQLGRRLRRRTSS